jgi:iron complex outermembrane recepter protein
MALSFDRVSLQSIRVLLHLSCAVLLCQSPAAAQTRSPNTSITDLKKLSVDQLTDVEVTSVSGAAERLGDAAAAVVVVTNEDIRRSGATTIPDALRMLPGIHVARQTSNIWAISSRGFSNVASEKLLVLSDTRSVYTPLFSGVFWDVQDHLLQDIARIEVIRGPGATLWGSNAVNGVINVTTKSAKDTQGLYAETSAGTHERAAAAVRYGGRLGERTYYRVFGSFAGRDESFLRLNSSTDDWQLGHVGARADWESLEGSALTIQGDLYRGHIGRIFPSVTIVGRPMPDGDLDVDVAGGNILGRYRRRPSNTSEIELRAYYDRTHRDDPSYLDDLHTFDVELQHRFALGERQEVTWGVKDRVMVNRNRGKGLFALSPPSSNDNLFGGFVQDQVRIRDWLHLTIGTKLEHNDFSGVEAQPSARVAWEISPPHTIWAALSRAVRVPTRLERDIAVDVTDPAADPIGRLLGNDAFDSEQVLAYEIGHRWQAASPLFIDVAAFHNRYDGLASLEIEAPFIDPTDGRTVIPVRNRNLTDGTTQGVELLGTVSARPNWRVTTSYTYVDVRLEASGQDQNRGKLLEGATPHHQFGVRSFLDLRGGFQLDGQLRSLAAVRQLPTVPSGEAVPPYTELDLRLAWRGWRQIEVSVVGRNLLHGHHPEFGAPAQRGEVERELLTKIAWGF